MSMERIPHWLAGERRTSDDLLEVRNKHTQDPIATVCRADDAGIDAAITAAVGARAELAAWPAARRRSALEHVAARLDAGSEAFAERLCIEGGKPIAAARAEAARAVATFRAASEVALEPGQPCEELPPAAVDGRSARLGRFPVGVCSFVTPFNFPLNLVAHKVAPAIAAGCPFVLKPASWTPLSALALGDLLAEVELPPGAWSILPATREGAARFSTDERFALLSFTGSDEVGYRLAANASHMRLVLELGGNAAAIVAEDWPLDDALERVVAGGFTGSGQSCISVQRLFVHRSRYAAFRDALVERVRALPCGDPRRDETVVGPLISTAEAERVEAWIAEARAAGARVLCGGERSGPHVRPTVLEEPPADSRVVRDEVFGPVVALFPYDDFEAVLRTVNHSRYGLQAGLFTRDRGSIERAFATLEVGGLMVGDAPSWRADPMPYGGVKRSGVGREGPRYALEHLTEPRLLVERGPGA